MKNIGIKIALYLNYFVFAILLNSVGIVILKSLENFHIAEKEASILEAFKDLPIAIVSFVVASFLPRIGYKKAMLMGLALVTMACLLMYFGNSFGSAKLLFAMVGVAFALIKVSVYSVIGAVTNDKKSHNAMMSSIEGVFMFGIALAYFLFPAFNTPNNPDAWLRVYWVLAGMTLISFVFLLFTPFEEPDIQPHPIAKDFMDMIGLLIQILTIIFLASAFLFVMIEQGIMSWLPTFNKKVLHLPENISIMMASILAISLGVGRILAGMATKKIDWIWVLAFSVVAAMLLVVFVLPKTVNLQVTTINSFADIPLIAFTFPLVGLFIGPIYPLLNSVILSALPKNLHSAMTGLIVVFSAIGGTLGSRIIGWLFEKQGPEQAFYFTLIPMTLLLFMAFLLKKITSKNDFQTTH
ncbi:MFS transporter [Flavobacterium branchiophilum]|uniref:Fucose permease n=3 Tax=Flavobacterium branchiophilum TaxID=55197 RepID=A0A2H3KP07_9FLAO|nr:MFS transporter [Flavobacterium branchiophilum]CCB68710.1 Major facilitator superfamily (MFS) permease. Probable sugar transporter [Flavobacterium branchiophilum FL-15]OXA69459.1 MFS transporter [Flavobacterium branchiophilum] [Flavobacterium branchiophilum NBRC 15030 = ATCC 35035]PDS25520.1 MFS transporter [Flavobacterium branchiophilum]TQM41086.1 fucose permease [Flavobacterium branchiophilum]GEM56678.1 MFS transporter [Flavobacterium branchiophilum NBRC 15030 = ATCC 35035]